jgi:hypothetical protein
MLELSPLLAIPLLFAIGATAGVGGAIAASWALRRKLYSLDYEVATLQDQLLREIKRRAGSETGKTKKTDQELLERMQNTEPARQPMWWEQYVGKGSRDI